VIQDYNIGGKYHGGVLALRGERRRKNNFGFLQSYIPWATYGEAIIVSGAECVCTYVPYTVVT
jgi:hypothetical protein